MLVHPKHGILCLTKTALTSLPLSDLSTKTFCVPAVALFVPNCKQNLFLSVMAFFLSLRSQLPVDLWIPAAPSQICLVFFLPVFFNAIEMVFTRCFSQKTDITVFYFGVAISVKHARLLFLGRKKKTGRNVTHLCLFSFPLHAQLLC